MVFQVPAAEILENPFVDKIVPENQALEEPMEAEQEAIESSQQAPEQEEVLAQTTEKALSADIAPQASHVEDPGQNVESATSETVADRALVNPAEESAGQEMVQSPGPGESTEQAPDPPAANSEIVLAANQVYLGLSGPTLKLSL